MGSVRVRPGFAREIEVPITRLVTGADVSLPVWVIHGVEDGPAVWVNAAIHGDEVMGVVRQAFRPELVFQEVSDLTATLTDERDDVDVGLRVATDLPHQHALTHAGAGEDSQPLAATGPVTAGLCQDGSGAMLDERD